MSEAPRLTALSKTAGCAAKIAQVDLKAALAHLPRVADPRVMIGLETADDAAVIRLSDDVALIETVDVFTPIVDDPYDYGRIAAANALSDVYAMGGRPLSALSFVAWPVSALGTESLGRVLAGAQAVCSEAGIALAGGHSIVDEEPKFGLFVTGLVHPSQVVANDGARPGDALVLTKPIGTGVLTTAFKRGHLAEAGLRPALKSMMTLNRAAAEVMSEVGARAATDVTGFGLLGHLGNVLRASSQRSGRPIGARLSAADVPLFEGALGLAEKDVCPGGSRRNLAYAAPSTAFAPGVPVHLQLLLADAQTSGGLLIAVDPSRLDALIAGLAARGVAQRAVIGTVTEASESAHIDVT
jgi:selenide,water dikinase